MKVMIRGSEGYSGLTRHSDSRCSHTPSTERQPEVTCSWSRAKSDETRHIIAADPPVRTTLRQKPDLRGGTDIDDFIRELEQEGVNFSEARREIATRRAAAGERLRLKDLRLRAGLSQRQLAEAAGMEQPNIARMESGHIADPKLSTLRRLAAALGTDLETVAGAFA